MVILSRIDADNKIHWMIAFIIVALIPVSTWLALYLLQNSLIACFSNELRRYLVLGNILTLLIQIMFFWAIWLIFSSVIHVLSILFGGTGSGKKLMILTGWLYLPFSVMMLLIAIYSGLYPPVIDTDLLLSISNDKEQIVNYLNSIPVLKIIKYSTRIYFIGTLMIIVPIIQRCYGLKLLKAIMAVFIPIVVYILVTGILVI